MKFSDPMTLLGATGDANDSIFVILFGFVFVLLVLSLLTFITTCIGRIFIRTGYVRNLKAETAVKEAAKSSRVPVIEREEASGSAEGEDPLLPVVIAAAIHCVLGDRPHRIVAIQEASPAWAQEGRRQIFSSHRVR